MRVQQVQAQLRCCRVRETGHHGQYLARVMPSAVPPPIFFLVQSSSGPLLCLLSSLQELQASKSVSSNNTRKRPRREKEEGREPRTTLGKNHGPYLRSRGMPCGAYRPGLVLHDRAGGRGSRNHQSTTPGSCRIGLHRVQPGVPARHDDGPQRLANDGEPFTLSSNEKHCQQNENRMFGPQPPVYVPHAC